MEGEKRKRGEYGRSSSAYIFLTNNPVGLACIERAVQCEKIERFLL